VPPLVDLLAGADRHGQRRACSRSATTPDYEPDAGRLDAGVRARQRRHHALEALYDYFAEGDGSKLIYFPIFNYNDGNLDVVREHAASIRARCSA
jgi:hypothetical protein